MTKFYVAFIFVFIVFESCAQLGRSNLIDSNGKTITTRFHVPIGYTKLTYKENSFPYYLSHFPLSPIQTKVKYYNGSTKINQGVAVSVLNIDVGTKDLQQCADAVMRLRAEYLFAQKKFTEIHFNFTNGFKAEYVKWADGNRIKVNGNNVSWVKTKEKDYSYLTFKTYLEIVFTYAGTLSLSKELKQISSDSIQVGDVFIKGGSPGHAVIVMDVAINKTNGKRIFLIAQSYMPAQSIHVLVNENNSKISPWYDLSEMDQLYTPEWVFEKSALKRFE